MPRMPSQGLGFPPLPGETEIPDYQFPPEPPAQRQEEPIERLESNTTRKEAREERRRAIEEMVEGIVEEKWTRFLTDAEEIRNQFGDLQNKIMLLEQSIKRLENDKQTELCKIEGKIDTYKQSMGEVSSRMEAVEGALKNSMTPMMQSIRSLTEAVKSIKNTKER
jgi:chromosome segregation ATPase